MQLPPEPPDFNQPPIDHPPSYPPPPPPSAFEPPTAPSASPLLPPPSAHTYDGATSLPPRPRRVLPLVAVGVLVGAIIGGAARAPPVRDHQQNGHNRAPNLPAP